jgi:CspA family cold shock protein
MQNSYAQFGAANADDQSEDTSSDENRQTGTVKWFATKKGYGFIEPEEGSEDIFVHANDVEMDGFVNLNDGQKVTFVIGEGRKGKKADQVRVVDAA